MEQGGGIMPCLNGDWPSANRGGGGIDNYIGGGGGIDSHFCVSSVTQSALSAASADEDTNTIHYVKYECLSGLTTLWDREAIILLLRKL